MNRSIRIASFLVLISCIVSCKKDKDSGSNKTRLSKLIQWNNANPSKGIITTEFIYDDQKRVAEIVTFSGDSTNGEIRSAKIRSLKFFYNGSDANPYRTVGSMPYWSATTADIFHKYNSNGALVQDSMAVTPYSSINLRNYTYGSDKIVVQNLLKESWGVQQVSRDSFRVANNNLNEAHLYITPYTTQISGYKLTYDDKINPVSKLNIASLFIGTSMFGFPSYVAPGNCKNNIIEYTYGSSTGPGIFTGYNTYYYTYFYNGNNLPEECRYNLSGSGTFVNNTIRYYYID